jgi:valine dehydrogenase (NAD+)
MGGVLNPFSVPLLRCKLVCGAANNMLSSPEAAQLLHERGIDYVPDFIANAGGIIAVADEMHGFDPDRTMARAEGIGAIVSTVISEANRSGESALRVAERMAAKRLADAAR